MRKTIKLYYHKTDGGAEYLCSESLEGSKEGSFSSKYIVRIDGDIEKDAELFIDEEGATIEQKFEREELLEASNNLFEELSNILEDDEVEKLNKLIEMERDLTLLEQ